MENHARWRLCSHASEMISAVSTILGILTVACLGIGLWLYGSTIVGKGPETPPAVERKDAMFMTQKNPARTADIPPLDAAAPTKTETATFALG